MSDSSPDSEQLLDAVRRDIDRVDSAILTLLAERIGLVQEIAARKIQHGLVFRARREIERVRAVEQEARKRGLPRSMLFDLWRIIMSQSSQLQRRFRIVCCGGAEMVATARAHFGLDVPVAVVEDLSTLCPERYPPGEVMYLFDRCRHDWWGKAADLPLTLLAELPWRDDAPPTTFLAGQCPVDLEAEADLLVLVSHSGRAAPSDDGIASVPLSLLARRTDDVAGRTLLRFADADRRGSLAEVESLLKGLSSGGTVSLLGRLPRFHSAVSGL